MEARKDSLFQIWKRKTNQKITKISKNCHHWMVCFWLNLFLLSPNFQIISTFSMEQYPKKPFQINNTGERRFHRRKKKQLNFCSSSIFEKWTFFSDVFGLRIRNNINSNHSPKIFSCFSCFETPKISSMLFLVKAFVSFPIFSFFVNAIFWFFWFGGNFYF